MGTFIRINRSKKAIIYGEVMFYKSGDQGALEIWIGIIRMRTMGKYAVESKKLP
jgi:hypothetical protein